MSCSSPDFAIACPTASPLRTPALGLPTPPPFRAADLGERGRNEGLLAVETETLPVAAKVESVTADVVAGDGCEGIPAGVAHHSLPAGDHQHSSEGRVEPGSVIEPVHRDVENGPAATQRGLRLAVDVHEHNDAFRHRQGGGTPGREQGVLPGLRCRPSVAPWPNGRLCAERHFRDRPR